MILKAIKIVLSIPFCFLFFVIAVIAFAITVAFSLALTFAGCDDDIIF